MNSFLRYSTSVSFPKDRSGLITGPVFLYTAWPGEPGLGRARRGKARQGMARISLNRGGSNEN